MSSGGGGTGDDPFSKLTNKVGNVLSKGVATIGNYYGFDHNGKWTGKSGMFRWADEGVGALDGRNSARKALNQSNNQYQEAKKQAQNLIIQNQWSKQQADVLGSQAAAAATATAKGQSGINQYNATPMAFGSGGGATPPGKDFLGL